MSTWEDAQYSREAWAVQRRKGLLRYMLTAKETWVFGFLMPCIFIVMPMLMGSVSYAKAMLFLSPLIFVGGMFLSWRTFKECEALWQQEQLPT